MTVRKSSTKKMKKVSISLSEREASLLQLYAHNKGITKGMAVKRILKANLQQYASMLESEVPCNQLGLFDGEQTDIFCIEDCKA